MKFKEINSEAKSYLKHDFKGLFITIFFYTILSVVLTGISEKFESDLASFIYSIIIFFVTLPFSYGITAVVIKHSRNEDYTMFDFISIGLQALVPVLKITLRTILKVILPLLLLFVGCLGAGVCVGMVQAGASAGLLLIAVILIIASMTYYVAKVLSYSLTYYIFFDHSELSSKEIVEKSSDMMKGNKWTYILISLYIVAIAALILGIILAAVLLIRNIMVTIIGAVLAFLCIVLIVPYSYALQAAFYNLLVKQNN